jgi:protein-tyrosine phosphatase
VCPEADEEVAVVVDRYVHHPFGDNSQFAHHVPALEGIAREAVGWIRAGHGVLAHCAYGVNRSGFVNALIIRELEQCTGREALAKLRARRKGAVGGNKHFERYLNEMGAPA